MQGSEFDNVIGRTLLTGSFCRQITIPAFQTFTLATTMTFAVSVTPSGSLGVPLNPKKKLCYVELQGTDYGRYEAKRWVRKK